MTRDGAAFPCAVLHGDGNEAATGGRFVKRVCSAGRYEWVFCDAVYAIAGAYEIRTHSGKGLGVFATRDIKEGERILCERPLATWTVDERSLNDGTARREEMLQCIVEALSPSKQVQFYALSQSERWYGEKKTALGVWMCNAYPVHPHDEESAGTVSAAVFRHICRINHSCSPNTHQDWNETLKRETVHCIQDIRAGEEFTLNYLGGPGAGYQRDARQVALMQKFGFLCDCSLCTLQDGALKQSEERQGRLSTISLHLKASPPPEDDEFVRLVTEKLLLLAQEGLPQCCAHVSMFEAMMRCRQLGNETAAARWATRATECARSAFGTDSSTYLLYEQLSSLSSA